MNKSGLVLVVKNTSIAAVGRITGIYRNGREAGAAFERTVPNTGDAAGDRHAGEAARALNKSVSVLVVKNTSIAAVGRITGIYRNGREAGAEAEHRVPRSHVPNTGDAAGDRHAG